MASWLTEADAAIRKVAAEQHWVVSADQAHAAGMTTAEVAHRRRAGVWRTVYQGVYLLDPDLYGGGSLPRSTQISAGLLAAGPHAVAVRETAAELLDLPVFGAPTAVHVAVPGRAARHRQDGLVIHQMAVPAGQHTSVDGLSTTSALRTVADLVCVLRRFDAVALVDASLNRGAIAEADLASVDAMIAGRRGCVAGREHLAEADGRAQSPAETRVRLICGDGNVMPDALQHPVYDGFGALLGYADLAWVTACLAAEMDGKGPHSTLSALFRDRHRQNDFTTVRWRVIRFTWADTYRPGYVIATVRAALATASPPGRS
jgi:hypothetical protein